LLNVSLCIALTKEKALKVRNVLCQRLLELFSVTVYQAHGDVRCFPLKLCSLLLGRFFICKTFDTPLNTISVPVFDVPRTQLFLDALAR